MLGDNENGHLGEALVGNDSECGETGEYLLTLDK